MKISVIICTHNPREDYLRRTLDGLKDQTLPKDQWELLLIDNASREPLAEKWDLAWHPTARHVREEELGLTPARLRGIRESKAETLVFVDDDNLLDARYLQNALLTLDKMPWLGAIGGQIIPEYEGVAPSWLLEYEKLLSNRKFQKPRWSNAVDDWQSQPWGAGLVIRRNVCNRYIAKLTTDNRFIGFDRKGESLMSSGDVDMVLTSIELGLGFGVFPEMIVTHLIPLRRMNLEYVCRITRGLVSSNLLLSHLRGDMVSIPRRRSLYTEMRGFYHFLIRSEVQKKIEIATQKGVKDFYKLSK